MNERCNRCGVIHLFSVRNGHRKHRCPLEPIPKWRVIAEWAEGKIRWFNVHPSKPIPFEKWIRDADTR